jgi:outer membrane protein OmpA-like peptidoglycan-associated protein
MSFNLLTAAKGLITNELVSKASSYLGESESGVTKALGGILPLLVSGIADKVNNNGGANTVSNLALQAHSSDFVNNLSGFFSNNNGASLLNKGAGIVSSLFGENKLQSLAGLISNFAGIKSISATSLLSMATPMVLGLLGKQVATNHLNGSGIASLMADQKKDLAGVIPSGLNLSSVFGDLSEKTHAAPRAQYSANETAVKAGTGLKWILPLLLLALAALAAYYLLGKGCNNNATAVDGSDSSRSIIGEVVANVKNIPGKLDSLTQDWIYDAGKDVTIDLPNNGGKLTVGETSTENKLYQFLMNSNAKLDTVKGNWFEFTNVHFKTGGTQLDSTSMIQLKNMVAIIKSFPTAEFKLGGYTDNTGDSAANVVLSQKRAETVVGQLKKLGTVPSAITGAKGYGPQWPLADNTTPEGRAQNRRVAINVKAK